jgi:hypothetical protein
MKRYLAFPVLVLILAILACNVSALGSNTIRGSGNVIQEERPVSGFSGIQVTNQGDAIIELGEAESLVVEAEDNLLEYIVTEVRGNTLVLGNEDNVNLNNTEPIRYHLTVQMLDDVHITSSGNVTAPTLEANTFAVRVSSSGNLDMDGIEANRLEVDISSSGHVNIGGGQVNEQDISITSSGEYDGRNVHSSQAQVRLSSSGDATIRVSERLRADLTSSGNVYYTGNPTVDVNESSSGQAIHRGE